MSERGVTGPIRAKVLIPAVLLAVALARAIVAALLGSPCGPPSWAAASCSSTGAWRLLTWRRARDRVGWRSASPWAAWACAGVVLGVLVLVGVLARPAFATAALSFLAGFTAYLGLRPFTYTPPAPAARKRGRQMNEGHEVVWALIVIAALVGLFLIPGGEKESLDVAGEFDLSPSSSSPRSDRSTSRSTRRSCTCG